MDVVSLILGPVLDHIVLPIGREFDCLFSYERNVARLESEHRKLMTLKNGVDQRIVIARRDLQDVSPHVQEWLKAVETMNSGVSKILESRERLELEQLGCLKNGCCPKLKSRYRLSKKSQKKIAEIVVLQNEGKEHVSFSIPVVSMVFENVATESMAEFESRKSIEVQAIAALKEGGKHVNVIGLCGMGGVGKTLMAKKIGKVMKEENIFHEVVMAFVGQEPNLNKIQGEIAIGLGLTLDEGSLMTRASRLHTRIMDAKKILIILDDVWRWIDLNELGIPSPDKHRSCKILLTSRLRTVCFQMKAKWIFTIPILFDAEAWSLFKQNACCDSNNLEDQQVLAIAKSVAEECKGLPIALVTVGRSMRNKNKRSWEDALVQLRRSMARNIPGVLNNVYRSLEWSYTCLESDEAKTLFLVCCLFPEDAHIPVDTLIRYGMGLHMFPDVENLEEARNRVHGLVEILKDRSLLNNNTEEENYVQMHGVVRDVAMFIASETFLVNHNIDSKKWPRRLSFQPFTHISLISGAFDELPESLDCPNLEMLLLECNFQPLKAADSFFARTTGLKVLEMRDFCIPSLPLSLERCTNLRTLQLHSCEFVKDISDVEEEEDKSEEVLSVISELLNLEILSFSYSTIKILPSAIANLSKLRLLDLTGCKYLNVIQPGIVSSLINLEEIYLKKSFLNWGAEIEGKEGSNLSLSELESLLHLTALAVLIPDTHLIPNNFQFPSTLKKYDLSIGGLPQEKGKEIGKKYEKIVCLNLPLPHSFGISFLQMLKNAEYLYSRGEGSSSAIEALAPDGFKNLKQLNLENCDNLRHLVNTEEDNEVTEDIQAVFPVLEKMYLDGISCLKEICNGQLPEGSFEKLRHLDFKQLPVLIHLWRTPNLGISLANLIFISLDECHRLQYLFSLSIAKSLQQLEQLKVNKCNVMEEIVAVENGSSSNEIEFPKLRNLGLGKLGNFGRFCGWIDHIHFPQLCNLRLNNLPKLKNFFHRKDESTDHHQLQPLFDEKKSFQSLQIMELSELASVTNLWSQKLATGLFRALEGLKVVSCHGLRNLFPSSVAKGLLNLKELEVCDCSAMEVIIEKEVEEEEEEEEERENKSRLSLFPQLEMLRLMTLDDLKRFSHLKHDLELKSLEHLEIKQCPKLSTFNPESIDTPKLEVLKVDDRQHKTNDLNTAVQQLFQEKQEGVPPKNYSLLPATDLSIASGSDRRYWDWIPMNEPSGESCIVAELLKVQTLDVRGRIKTRNLSPGVTYEVCFVVMLKEPTKGWEEPVNLSFILPNGAIIDRTENLKIKPRNRWMELYLGEFEIETAENDEAIKFALLQKNTDVLKKGLVIKGVIVRPKEHNKNSDRKNL